MDYLTVVCWLAVFKNFYEAYFTLYPVFNWKPVKLFHVGDDMGKLGRMSDNPTE